jgi:deoxyribodipyrimidine photo-lyase
MEKSQIDPERIQSRNSSPVRKSGSHVLYWMTSARRLEWNQGLERAVEWARTLDHPLLIFEALRIDYPWASQRLHRFCIEGMADHARRLDGTRVGYYPYVEREASQGKGLLTALAETASVVVTDAFPSFFLPRMLTAAASILPVRLEAVDSNGVLPLQRPDRDFRTAYSFRRYLQRVLPGLLAEGPRAYPLTGDPLPPFPGVSRTIQEQWPPVSRTELDDPQALVESLPLTQQVPPVPIRGGRQAAARTLTRFLEDGLPGYAQGRNHPDRSHVSGLSPYLHWGHISSREVVDVLLDQEGWRPDRLAAEADGRREGWWGLSSDAEGFLDQLVTWRELGYLTAWRNEDHESWDTLPEWARDTLNAHASDPRPHLYDLEEFQEAGTHDPLWNAAQRQLRAEGTIHNYLRMLWGKKILEWSPSPQDALDWMLELNNRWALDGRNPNSTSGIFWTLGRYDRGWPERPVFGKVRSMTSRSTRRKVELTQYLKRYGPTSG